MKQKSIATFIYILLLLITIGFVPTYAQTIPKPPQGQDKPPTQRPLKDPPPDLYGGIEILRSELLKQITNRDSSLIFSEVEKVDGKPQLKATGLHGSHVEIVGTEKNIKQGKETVIIYSVNRDEYTAELARLAWFVVLTTGQPGLDWFYKQLHSFASIGSPLHTETKLSVRYKLIFDYVPETRSVSVTVIAW